MANKLVTSSDLKSARKLEKFLLRKVARAGYGEKSVFAIKLALEEGLNNAIKHGNRGDSSKKIEVGFDIDSSRACFTITDQGSGFDLAGVPDPTADENLEKPSGRGIMLIKAYMDEVSYSGRGNSICMVKRNTSREQ